MTEKEIIQEIDRYIRGELSGEEIDRLWMEFLKQPEYFKLFETDLHFRQIAKEYKEKGENPLGDAGSDSGTITSRYRLWIAAAAVMLIVAGTQWFLQDRNGQLAHFALTQIEVTQLAGVDIYRSSEDDHTAVEQQLGRALGYAYDGNDQLAIEAFEEVINLNPEAGKRMRVHLNLGILYYNSGEYREAAHHFEMAGDTEGDGVSTHITERASWFLGNTYLHLEEVDKAISKFEDVIAVNGRYHQQASNLLRLIRERDSEPAGS